ncbi:MAG: CapA family protein [Epulopiscium sp.]|nr:CapA family protein [Candidatus Epulonipiscium sp.]
MKFKFGLLLIVIIIFTGCTLLQPRLNQTFDVDIETPEVNQEVVEEVVLPEKIEEESEPEQYHVILSAVGDIMVHRWQLEGAYDIASKSYNFAHSFELVAPYIQQADYAIANLETTLAGEERGYQGYPRFNTPEVLAENLKDAGFDLMTTANNHSMDSNAEGVLHTLQVLDEVGLDYVGTHKTQEDSERIFIKEINHISFAFLSYTYGTNGLPLPKEQPYLVNTWDMYEPSRLEAMYAKVREAKEQNPDFVVISVHFGNEYKSFPNDHQERIVKSLFEAGADIILGSHPHVLQPIEVRQIPQDDGQVRTGIVIYSLGNFISSQQPTQEDPAPKDVGIIFNIDIQKIEGEKAIMQNISFIPTWVQWIRKNNKPFHRIIPVEQALREIEEGQETTFTTREITRMKQVKMETVKHMMHYIEIEPEVRKDIYYIPLQN